MLLDCPGRPGARPIRCTEPAVNVGMLDPGSLTDLGSLAGIDERNCGGGLTVSSQSDPSPPALRCSTLLVRRAANGGSVVSFDIGG
jgi:hypothetical protein